jgi:hypothetical protein
MYYGTQVTGYTGTYYATTQRHTPEDCNPNTKELFGSHENRLTRFHSVRELYITVPANLLAALPAEVDISLCEDHMKHFTHLTSCMYLCNEFHILLVSIISGPGAAMCAAVVAARCNGKL